MRILELISLKGWLAARRRRRYDEIKALIVEQHLQGKGGLILPGKYGAKDTACFRPPMYFHARTDHGSRCIFWRKELMSEEVGAPRLVPTAQLNEAR